MENTTMTKLLCDLMSFSNFMLNIFYNNQNKIWEKDNHPNKSENLHKAYNNLKTVLGTMLKQPSIQTSENVSTVHSTFSGFIAEIFSQFLFPSMVF